MNTTRVYGTKVCPHCGHPMPADEVTLMLTPRQRQLYEIVRDAGIAGISARDILDKMYADEPNGGPDTANIISVFAHHANVRLKPFGLEISARRGPWPMWKLVGTPDDAS